MMFYEADHEIQNHSDQHPHVEGMGLKPIQWDIEGIEIQMENRSTSRFNGYGAVLKCE